MLIKVELLKKETNMLVGGLAEHEFETAALKLSTLMSAGRNDQKPEKWTDAMFAGLPSTLTINEPFDEFLERANKLSLQEAGNG